MAAEEGHIDRKQVGEGRNEGVSPSRRLHRHRHRVVDEQGDGRHLGNCRAEIVPGHHVGPTSPGVDHHHFPVGEGDEGEHQQQREGDGQDEGERGDPHDAHQLDQHLLGPVGRRGDGVGRQDTQGHEGPQPLVGELLADQGPAQEDLFYLVAQQFGQLRGDRYGATGLRFRTCPRDAHWRLCRPLVPGTVTGAPSLRAPAHQERAAGRA